MFFFPSKENAGANAGARATALPCPHEATTLV